MNYNGYSVLLVGNVEYPDYLSHHTIFEEVFRCRVFYVLVALADYSHQRIWVFPYFLNEHSALVPADKNRGHHSWEKHEISRGKNGQHTLFRCLKKMFHVAFVVGNHGKLIILSFAHFLLTMYKSGAKLLKIECRTKETGFFFMLICGISASFMSKVAKINS